LLDVRGTLDALPALPLDGKPAAEADCATRGLTQPLLSNVRRGRRKAERYANVRPEVRENLDLLGRELP